MSNKTDILKEITRLLLTGKHVDKMTAKALTKDLAKVNKAKKQRDISDLNNQKSLF